MTADRERTSRVQYMKVYSVGYASALFIGDLYEFIPEALVLAIQREISRFSGSEGELEAYPLFSVPLPQPLPFPLTRLEVVNTIPEIRVGTIRVLAVSTSCSLHVGRLHHTKAQSRVKNIREKQTASIIKP
ncbi:spore germination protein GerPE [Paenibacillus filicis]|uniref:Spore germination protein GerPE n=1 Tax=Paenibacillus filicis TaxID=669464 RepID=A0ABU9DP01_9BACL